MSGYRIKKAGDSNWIVTANGRIVFVCCTKQGCEEWAKMRASRLTRRLRRK